MGTRKSFKKFTRTLKTNLLPSMLAQIRELSTLKLQIDTDESSGTESPYKSTEKSIENYLKDLLPSKKLYDYAIEIYTSLSIDNHWHDTDFVEDRNKIQININPREKNQNFSSINIVFGDSIVCKKIGIRNDSPHFNELYAKILKEVVLQIYAENLTRNSRVKVPEVYGVSKTEENGITFISIFMEFLEKIVIKEKELKKWARRIPRIFEKFAKRGLYHLDTAHRNVYFTTGKKLAIIDFGEAKNNEGYDETIFALGQPTGYPVMDERDEPELEMFKKWMNGERTSEFGTYGGMRRRKRHFSKKRPF